MYVCQISLGYLIITRMKCISFQTKQYFSDEFSHHHHHFPAIISLKIGFVRWAGEGGGHPLMKLFNWKEKKLS